MNFGIFFGARKEGRRKKLGYYEIENIDNPCIITLAVNPKEYLEVFWDFKLDKKHKGIKKRLTGLGFENFAERIKSLINFDTFEKPPADKKEVSLFSVIQGKMVKKTVIKNKFSQFNDKRFYFADGIVSLLFGHKNLKEIDEFKEEKGQKIKKYFWEEKEVLFNMEKTHWKIPQDFISTAKFLCLPLKFSI